MPLPSVLDEINRLFDEMIRRPWGAASRHLVPAELRQVKDGWVVQFPVEGMRAKDLQVEVHGQRLVITGQRQQEREQRHPTGWSRSEQAISFHRTVILPPDADLEDIDAKIEDSTLSIHIGRRRP
jgi:HSP20 family protein